MVLSDPRCCVRYNIGEDKNRINGGTSGMGGYGFRHVDPSELFSQIHGRGGGFSLFSNGGGRRFGGQRGSSSFLALSLVILSISLIGVRSANSKPELSQLLFISVRQRELIKSSRWIGLSTYTSVTWSVHYFPTLPYDHVT